MCPMWFSPIFRWPEFGFSLPSSIFRWPDFNLSYFTSGWAWNSPSFGQRWMEFSIVDDVLWIFVTMVESLAVAAMLCYFFVFCGCTV
ncbi:hypothetical protein SLA2020_395210 [Shorea laevis]